MWPRRYQPVAASASRAGLITMGQMSAEVPMLKLYNAPHSTCSQKVRICLAEKNLPFEDIRLDLGKGKDQLKPEYLKLNPNGVVPTLVDDGHVIIDSSVICEYLDEKYPAPSLSPGDVAGR